MVDLSLVIVGAGLLIGSVVLSFTIERAMRRLGVSPAAPDERSGGIRDVARRIERWRQSRENPDR
jgi:hypothetical protein